MPKYTFTKVPVPPRQEPMNWLEQQFHDTGWPMLIMLTVLFFVLMWVFSGIGVLVSRNPVARRKTRILFTVCSIYLALTAAAIWVIVHSPPLPPHR